MSTVTRLIARLTVAAAAAAAAGFAAQSPVESRIDRVVKGLLPPVVLKGQPAATTKLVDRMRDGKIPGVSIAVFVDGRIDWARGWGLADVASDRKVDSETRFQAASISKPVAAVAALALVSRGRLALDADVNASLRTWTLPANDFTKATAVSLRHLLTHSAGTTVSGFRGYAKGEEVPGLVQVLDGAKPANSAPVRVDIAVGSQWRYSGGGFSVVQLLIQDETGKPFAQAARELVLEPFEMSRSTYLQPLPPELRDNLATAYRADGTPVDGRWHVYPEQAAAGLWTTPSDLARFAIGLQRIAAGGSTKVMSRDLARDMLRRQVDDYGLGVGVYGEGAATRFGHGGSNVGFRCYFVGFRDTASGVVIMTNSDAGSALLQDVVRAAAREYKWPGLSPIERTLGSADPATYKDFAGRYEIPIRSPPVVLQIDSDGQRLFRVGAGPRAELLPEDPTTFFALDSDFRIRFVRDASGRVGEAQVWQGSVERKAVRAEPR